MSNLSGYSETGRVKKSGDMMTGDLDMGPGSGSESNLLELSDGLASPVQYAAMRRNGDDLEFYDTTLSAWVKLSDLTASTGDVHEVAATVGQTIFDLPFSYHVGGNVLMVFVNGTRAYGPGAPVPAFAETTSTRVTWLDAVPWGAFAGGEIVSFCVPGRPLITGMDTVKVTATDTTGNYLNNKIAVVAPIVKATLNGGANEQLELSASLGSSAPPADGGAGSAGVASVIARSDHQHPADDWDNLVAHTIGELPIFGSGGNPSRLSPGTATYVLTSNGPGAVPSYQAVPAVTPGSTLLQQNDYDFQFFYSMVAANTAYSHDLVTALAWPVGTVYVVIRVNLVLGFVASGGIWPTSINGHARIQLVGAGSDVIYGGSSWCICPWLGAGFGGFSHNGALVTAGAGNTSLLGHIQYDASRYVKLYTRNWRNAGDTFDLNFYLTKWNWPIGNLQAACNINVEFWG